MVQRVLKSLAEAKLVVISGLAYGIDAHVHRTALAFKIPSIAILAGGFEKLYPSDHLDLAIDLIENGGALVTEHEPNVPARKHDFLRRNRIIAGWSNATWMVEAPFKSGAMNTASWAEKLGRDLYATPSHPEDASMAGNHKLIKDHHATPIWEALGLSATWSELASHPVVVENAASESYRKSIPVKLDRQVLATIQKESSQFGKMTEWDLRAWSYQMGISDEMLKQSLENLQRAGHLSWTSEGIRPR